MRKTKVSRQHDQRLTRLQQEIADVQFAFELKSLAGRLPNGTRRERIELALDCWIQGNSPPETGDSTAESEPSFRDFTSFVMDVE